MNAATLTPVPRRTFGLNRTVYVIRCLPCKWRTELRVLRQAEVARAKHRCISHLGGTP